ncbi:endoplasmic reticulum metallopeptidase 1-like [Babylonia areolata]|uniref:endoplasmic reticulum metallopeptidase 1-like n=1 Tax=Babylonia areolata TaxID=304850 RepID=UPI003FD56306
MDSTLRKRNNDGPSLIRNADDLSTKKKKEKKDYIDGLTLFVSLAAVYGAVWLFVHICVSHFPKPADLGTAKLSDFVETRARKHLTEITNLGPRVAGSNSSEAAAGYIVAEIAKIQSAANRVHTIELDVQVVSGTFVMNFEAIGIGSFASVYENQKNVVVRIGPQELTHSLLVNCHYDTVVDSPGTSDDAVSCAVMLEVLHALSKQDQPLPHNIIFLFNGAEENILQTSHGFITQHKWAPSIRAFVNLESAGAGGWELLFQTGPDHPWLIETYIAAAPHPHSSVIGQEIFQGGLVPSDTDFRIFRDYGKIPGLDLAHIRNGYVYHTVNDLPSFVEPGCLQRTGNNILALVKALVKSPYLVDPGDYRHGSLVFFDFLGFFMVAYPQRLAVLLNWAMLAVVLVRGVRAALSNTYGTARWMKYQAMAVGGVILTWVVMMGVAIAVGFFMTLIGREMAYYSRDYNVMFLFVCPAVAVALALHLALKDFCFQAVRGHDVAELYFEANLLLWSVVVGVLTYCGIMSAFAPLMFILGPLSARLIAHLTSLSLQDHRVYTAVTLGGMLVPQLYMTYQGFILLTFFIPIMGRTGTEAHPDIIVAVMTMLPVAMVLTSQMGLVYLSRGMGRVVRGLLVVTVVAVVTLALTPLGFPFSSQAPTKQRMLFAHVDRQVHSPSGQVLKRDSSIWVSPSDHLGMSLIRKQPGDLFRSMEAVDCEGTYCGRPYLYPVLSLFDARKTVDFPAPLLSVPRMSVTLVRSIQLTHEIRRMDFEIAGPDHMTIYISPVRDVHVVRWSFGHEEPVFINTLPTLDEEGRDTHFVYYSYGSRPTEPWAFHIEFYTPPTLAPNSSIVDISFAGHYLHGEHQYTPAMTHFRQHLPSWTTANGWSSTLDIFQF